MTIAASLLTGQGVFMKVIWFFIAAIFLHGTARADIKFKLHFSPIANLVYQLDCISGELLHCSRNSYTDLWKKNFIKGSEDQALIKDWGELMNRYRFELELEESKEKTVSGRPESVRLSTKIRIASFQSSTMDEYFSRLDLVVSPKDRIKFEKIVRIIYPRFEKWWKATALPKGKGFASKIESLLVSREIANKLQQFSQFYAVELPDNYYVHFNLFYRPDFEEATTGEQIENYSVAEFLPSEKPVDRIDVIIHELCHFFYNNSTDENRAALQKNIELSGGFEGRVLYSLLNETLATTLGNGLINKLTMTKERWERYSSNELSLYNNYHIDKAAKVILPWMEEWINKGRNLYEPQFVSDYVLSLKKAFGAELSAPRLMLNEFALIADNKYGGKFGDAVRKFVGASSMHISEGKWSDDRLLRNYKKNKNQNVLVIVHPSNLNQLKDKGILSGSDFDQIKNQYKNNEQIIYSFKRTSSAQGYVIAAPSYEKTIELIEKIGSLRQGFEGAYQGP